MIGGGVDEPLGRRAVSHTTQRRVLASLGWPSRWRRRSEEPAATFRFTAGIHFASKARCVMADTQVRAPSYNPFASYEVEVKDIVYRQDGGRSYPARVFQPRGQGPF